MRCVQGAWGVKSKPARVRRTRMCWGHRTRGRVKDMGGHRAVLLWPGGFSGQEEEPAAQRYPSRLLLRRGPGGACPLSPICSAGLASFPFR